MSPWWRNDRDGIAFMRRIVEDPHDDVVRLVFADWLEERGEELRAEFIRLSIELANSDARQEKWRSKQERYERIRLHHQFDWLAQEGLAEWENRYSRRNYGAFGRGFVEELILPFDAFGMSAANIFENHPITTVIVRDLFPKEMFKQPRRDGSGWWRFCQPDYDRAWWATGGKEFCGVFSKKFDTMSTAGDALSAACVAYGRRVANLPPLRAAA
jgi:uncharacterized protein (TIGR02996 family)